MTGNGRDIVILLNETANATSAIRNLQGEVVFRTSEASFCRLTSITADRSFRRYVRLQLADKVPLDGDEHPSSIRCTISGESADLILLERKHLEEVPAVTLKLLLDAIRSRDFSIFVEISFEGFQRALDLEKVQAAQLESQILKERREGHGFVALEHEGRTICSTADIPLPIVARLAEDTPDPLGADLHLGNLEPVRKHLEEAFTGAKTGECRVIFGDNVALLALIEGFRRDAVPYHVLRSWFSEEHLRQAISDYQLAREDEIRRSEQERIRLGRSVSLIGSGKRRRGNSRREDEILRDRFSSTPIACWRRPRSIF